MKLQETITTVKTLDNTTATFKNGVFGMVELDEDGASWIDNPLDCGNTIRFFLDLGRSRGGYTYSKSADGDGDITDLYDAVNKIENDNLALYNGANSPIDCEWQIDADGYEIEDADGNLIENPRHSDKYDLEDGDNFSRLAQAAQEKGFYLASVYVYDHSLVKYSLAPFNDPWDSCENGIAWATPADMERDGLKNFDDCNKQAASILRDFTAYMNGEVYSVAAAPAEYDEENDIVTIKGEWEYCGGILGFDGAEMELPRFMQEIEPCAATA